MLAAVDQLDLNYCVMLCDVPVLKNYDKYI